MVGPGQVNVLHDIENRLPKGFTIHEDNMTMSIVICLRDYHHSISYNSLRDTENHNLLKLVNQVVSHIQESILNDYANGKLELSYKKVSKPAAESVDWREARRVAEERTQSSIAPQSPARKTMHQWSEPKKPSEVVVEGGIKFDF